ncbi:uncharacterized protein AMSG_10309 [Thecamonas trahens ATCC 50062]|uniref:BEACH domain-containing protein n=1 Tax=Thecamonas trahens ATCC 50062 TaxID=461836 RepID=A0A0L0DQK5_THETB|nr:hypothetical protein AMSG_10309 [Thecamonas trahens ATCC 50062]KNC54321.1 hypothetical protein AMSG_10309 [Thecamonas trahens ATCC 50062]|eukprot:XP_013753780.1 hypothetical protein AMSG_10309 [Thecamonas trahens ATCC 50062]
MTKKVVSLETLAKDVAFHLPLLIDDLSALASRSAKIASLFEAYFEPVSAYGMAAASMRKGALLVDARKARLSAQLEAARPVLDAFLASYAEIKRLVRKRAQLFYAHKSASKAVAKGKIARGEADAAWSSFSAFNETAKADLDAFLARSHSWLAPVFDCIARAQVYMAAVLRDAYLSDLASHVVLADVPAVPTNPFKASALTLDGIDDGSLALPDYSDSPSPWDVQDDSLDVSDSLIAEDVLRLDTAAGHRTRTTSTLSVASASSTTSSPPPRSGLPIPRARSRLSRPVSVSSFVMDWTESESDGDTDSAVISPPTSAYVRAAMAATNAATPDSDPCTPASTPAATGARRRSSARSSHASPSPSPGPSSPDQATAVSMRSTHKGKGKSKSKGKDKEKSKGKEKTKGKPRRSLRSRISRSNPESSSATAAAAAAAAATSSMEAADENSSNGRFSQLDLALIAISIPVRMLLDPPDVPETPLEEAAFALRAFTVALAAVLCPPAWRPAFGPDDVTAHRGPVVPDAALAAYAALELPYPVTVTLLRSWYSVVPRLAGGCHEASEFEAALHALLLPLVLAPASSVVCRYHPLLGALATACTTLAAAPSGLIAPGPEICLAHTLVFCLRTLALHPSTPRQIQSHYLADDWAWMPRARVVDSPGVIAALPALAELLYAASGALDAPEPVQLQALILSTVCLLAGSSYGRKALGSSAHATSPLARVCMLLAHTPPVSPRPDPQIILRTAALHKVVLLVMARINATGAMPWRDLAAAGLSDALTHALLWLLSLTHELVDSPVSDAEAETLVRGLTGLYEFSLPAAAVPQATLDAALDAAAADGAAPPAAILDCIPLAAAVVADVGTEAESLAAALAAKYTPVREKPTGPPLAPPCLSRSQAALMASAPWLGGVFDLLTLLCSAGSMREDPHHVGPEPPKSDDKNDGPAAFGFNTVVIDALFSLFNEATLSPIEARLLATRRPLLQTAVLSLLTRLLGAAPDRAPEALLASDALDFLMGPFFYFVAVPPHALDPNAGADTDPTSHETVPCQTELEQLSLWLLVYLVTSSSHKATSAVLRKLLYVLAAHAHVPVLVHNVCMAILAVLCVERGTYAPRLRAVDTLAVITSLLKAYFVTTESAETPPRAYTFTAQHSLMQVVDAYFAPSDEIYYDSLVRILDEMEASPEEGSSGPALPALLDVLLDHMSSPRLAVFGITHYARLIRAAAHLPSSRVLFLYNRYLEAFPSEASRDAETAELQLQLLAGIRYVLRRSQVLHQGRFLAVDSFVKCMHAMHQALRGDEAQVATLWEAMFKAFMALMASNASAKAAFGEIIGYPQLTSMFMHTSGNAPSRRDFKHVFDMLVDGGFSTKTRYTIRNPACIRVIFDLLGSASPKLQTLVLNTVLTIVSKTTINVQLCCGEKLLERILDILETGAPSAPLVPLLVQLVEILGRHNVTVKELRLLVRLLHPRDGHRSPLFAPLLNALVGMTIRKGPSSFFHFDGRGARLAVAPLPNVIGSGYTFYTWLRIEDADAEPGDIGADSASGGGDGDDDEGLGHAALGQRTLSASTDDLSISASSISLPQGREGPLTTIGSPLPTPASALPVRSWSTSLARTPSRESVRAAKARSPPRWLFSFLSEAGLGVEAYIQAGELTCVSHVGATKIQRASFPEFKFAAGEWYHVALVHSHSRVPWSTSELALYVNGELVAKKPLRIPSLGSASSSAATSAALALAAKSSPEPALRSASLRPLALVPPSSPTSSGGGRTNSLPPSATSAAAAAAAAAAAGPSSPSALLGDRASASPQLRALDPDGDAARRELPFCYIGSSVPGGSAAAASAAASSSTAAAAVAAAVGPGSETLPYCGQLGPVYLLRSALPATTVADIYSLGPEYGGPFHETDYSPHTMPESTASLFSGELKRWIVFAYNARAASTADGVVTDNALHPDGERSSNAVLADVTPCVARPIAKTITNLGGVKVLFPLLRQLDMPVVGAEAGAEAPPLPQPELLNALLTLIFELLLAAPAEQEAFLQISGARVLGHLLKSLTPGNMSLALVDTLARSVYRLRRELAAECFKHILFQPALFIYAHVSVQAELIHLLTEYVVNLPAFFRSLVGVQFLLDALRQYYWFSTDHASLARRPFLHPVTGTVVAHRPPRAHIMLLRKDIKALIACMVVPQFTRAEVDAMVAFLLDAQDWRQLFDLVQTLVHWLTGAPRPPFRDALRDTLAAAGGIYLCFDLLGSAHEIVRVAALRLLGCLVLEVPSVAKSFRAEHLGWAGVTNILSMHSPGVPTLHALLDLALGRIRDLPAIAIADKAEVASELDQLASLPYEVLPEELNVVLPGALQPLLAQLAALPVPSRLPLLAHLRTLLKEAPRNADVLVADALWAERLAALLPRPDEDGGEALTELVVAVVGAALEACVTNKGSWRLVQDVLIAVHHAAASGGCDGLGVSRSVLAHAASRFHLDADHMFSLSENAVLDNVVHIVLLCEAFLFATPSTLAEYSATVPVVHIEPTSGMWLDAGLGLALVTLVLDTNLMCLANKSVVCELARATVTTVMTGLALASRGEAAAYADAVPRLLSALEATCGGCGGMVEVDESGEGESGGSGSTSVSMWLVLLLEALMVAGSRLGSFSPPAQVPAEVMGGLAWIARSNDAALRWLLATAPEVEPLLDAVEKVNTPAGAAHAFSELSAGLREPRIQERVFGVIGQALEAELSEVRERTRARRIKSEAGVLLATRRVRQEEVRQVKTLHMELAEFVAQTKYGEINRRSQASIKLEESARRSGRAWRRTLRAISQARDPWSGAMADVEHDHWKLDAAENGLRMRRKMERNYEFDTHALAAARRDKRVVSAEARRALSSAEELGPMGPGAKLDPGSAVVPGAEGEGGLVDWTLLDDDGDEAGASDSESSGESGVLELVGGEASEESGEREAKVVYATGAERVTLMSVVKGVLELSARSVAFRVAKDVRAEAQADDDDTPEVLLSMYEDLVWPLEALREVHVRRYRFRDAALEVFLADRTNYFIAFPSRKVRNEVARRIVRLKPPQLVFHGIRAPREVFRRSSATAAWQRGELSNFEYLMLLNTMAGRSYNDINQYPVFPWVLDDYTSDELDLDNPATFRDLSRPVGALDERSLARGLERYSFDDEMIPKFHWGSHYSSGGAVLYYMIRVEPFTSLHVQLQGGKFDHADRVFSSVAATWANCKTAGTDPKELIPEWYYLPEMFLNTNGFDLGQRSSDGVFGAPRAIGDVHLPPWAHGSAHEFVRLHRLALESPYVTAHLHEWINLVFGFQQRGPAAVEAHNIFYFLTYEGAIDIDAVEDETMRASYESQISEFGQTPSQLLDKPHPEVLPSTLVTLRAAAGIKPKGARARVLFDTPGALKAFFVQVMDEEILFLGVPSSAVSSRVASLIGSSDDRIVTVSRSRVVASHRWLPGTANAQGAPFSFERDPGLALAKSGGARKRMGVPLANGLRVSAACFALLDDGKSVLSCGYWDSSFKVSLLESGRSVQSVTMHSDVVSCLATDAGGRVVVTGSKDASLMVWELETGSSGCVSAVALSSDLDVIVSGSLDGTCMVHKVSDGSYVRTLTHPRASPVTHVAVSPDGEILMYSLADLVLYQFSINGVLLASVDTTERLSAVVVNKTGEYVVSGGERGVVVVRAVHTLEAVRRTT